MRYKVTLNWYGELHVFWTHASSGEKAKRNSIEKLAAKLKRKAGYLIAYFDGKKDNFIIMEVPVSHH